MKTPILMSFALVLAAVLAVPSVSFANGGDGGRQGERGWFGGQVQSWINLRSDDVRGDDKNIERRCEHVEKKIDQKIAKFDENRTRHLNAFTRLETRLANFEVHAEEEGLDTATLESQLEILGDKVDIFVADYNEYVEALRLARNYACETDNAEFKAQLEIAKGLLLEARASGLDAKMYYWNTVRVEVKDLKAELEVEADISLNV